MLGPSKAGKSTLIKFLKGINYKDDDKNDTWGVHVHLLEWEPQTPNTLIRYSFWDSGSNYLKKYPFETEHLVKDCDALIYMTDYENLSDLKFTET